MTLEKYLLDLIMEHKFTYKGIAVNFFGFPVVNKYSKSSLKNTLYKIKKEGYVENINGYLKITKSGNIYLNNSTFYLESFSTILKGDEIKNLLVVYDIPEDKKRERDWFRFQLKKFGFVMIQRSVWVGPSPLPDEFIKYIKKIKLNDKFKTFKLAKSYFDK
ncbi:MAG: CRISPR-associated endonuclease Cas2 [Candidatus Pacebacteria bacterium]|nr:CRISPR-associated endonuclease Cas2 [Candidatus Paceibacterota bacterium]